jgi:hypothetical protein
MQSFPHRSLEKKQMKDVVERLLSLSWLYPCWIFIMAPPGNLTQKALSRQSLRVPTHCWGHLRTLRVWQPLALSEDLDEMMKAFKTRNIR